MTRILPRSAPRSAARPGPAPCHWARVQARHSGASGVPGRSGWESPARSAGVRGCAGTRCSGWARGAPPRAPSIRPGTPGHVLLLRGRGCPPKRGNITCERSAQSAASAKSSFPPVDARQPLRTRSASGSPAWTLREPGASGARWARRACPQSVRARNSVADEFADEADRFRLRAACLVAARGIFRVIREIVVPPVGARTAPGTRSAQRVPRQDPCNSLEAGEGDRAGCARPQPAR